MVTRPRKKRQIQTTRQGHPWCWSPGATKVSGRYTENPGTKDEKKVGERSHVVSSGKMGKKRFKKAITKFGKKYNQDSVLIKKKPKGDAALVGTNKSLSW